jgi:hypothetical protein
MEPEGSLPHSQEPATCPYREHGLRNMQKKNSVSLYAISVVCFIVIRMQLRR